METSGETLQQNIITDHQPFLFTLMGSNPMNAYAMCSAKRQLFLVQHI
jgi:hypothetical protein